MKRLLILVTALAPLITWSQTNEKEAIQLAIETFFEGFHKQDSLALRNSVSDVVILQTISKDSIGNTIVASIPFEKFAQQIVSIPKETRFKEKLKSFSIQIDSNMAAVWAPYEFWVNDTFHHCGVNSFQHVKYAEDWKIVYLIDTRRKEDCE